MKYKNLIAGAVASVTTFSLMTVPAFALTAGGVFNSLSAQATSANKMVTIVAFIIGVILAIVGILKLKAHTANPNDPSAKMSTGFILIFAGAALVALPAMLGMGAATFFGEGAKKTNATAGFNQL